MNERDEGNSGVGRDVITNVNLEYKDDDAEIASRSQNIVCGLSIRCSVV